MRRDWLGTHVAAAVAVPLVLGLQPHEVAAVNAGSAATILAQAAGPGGAVSSPSDAVPSATAPDRATGAATTATTPNAEATGSAQPSAARNLDSTSEDGGVVPPVPEGEVPF